MGADMCLSDLWIKAHKEIKAEDGHAHIETLTYERLLTERRTDFYIDSICMEIPLEAERVRTVKAHFHEALDGVLQSLNSREVTRRSVLGWHVYLTGGMTWGDDPSEAFGVWAKLIDGAFGYEILRAAGFEFPGPYAEPYVIQELGMEIT